MYYFTSHARGHLLVRSHSFRSHRQRFEEVIEIGVLFPGQADCRRFSLSMNCLKRKSPRRLLLGYSGPRSHFQIMSDLHLEIGQQYPDFMIPPKAPYLILAGDIGRLKDYQMYLQFLQRQCAVFTKVFLVLGNHEFFGVSRARGLELAGFLENEPACHGKLYLLHRTRVDLDDLNIVMLGCTLHSKIPSKVQLMVQMKVSDFHQIENWTVDDHNAEHQSDVIWLQQEVSKIRTDSPRRRVLVITHHAPTIKGTSKPVDVGSPLGSAFATELLRTRHLADVQCWIFGHTHCSTEFKRRRVWLVSNQRGYVLNGIALQGQVVATSRQSLFHHILRRRGRIERDFDVEKVIKL